ncbi:hypothetical protein VTO42DRAFT_1770 [Malbranchea cinnamomea]
MDFERPLKARFGEIHVPKKVKPGEFTYLPVVDLADLNSPSLEARKRLAAQIFEAATIVGFFYIKNHGVPEDLIEHTRQLGRQYFALPHEAKMEQFAGKGDGVAGYFPPLHLMPNYAKEFLRVSGGPGVEGFEYGYDIEADSEKGPEDKPRVDRYKLDGPRDWPSEALAPGFHEGLVRYYGAMLDLSRKLVRILALAVELPEDTFDEYFTWPAAMTRFMHYLHQQKPEHEPSSIEPHTDLSAFTILSQGEVSGLQVRNASGEWISAPVIPGTFVVNIGDIFHYWTNGLLRSTSHRAINLTGENRLSIAYFFNPDSNAEIKVLNKFVSEEHPPIHEPFVVGAWVRRLMGLDAVN